MSFPWTPSLRSQGNQVARSSTECHITDKMWVPASLGRLQLVPGEKSVQLGEFMKTKCVLPGEYVALGGCRNWERPHFLKLFSTNPSRYYKKKKSRKIIPCGRPGGGVEQLLRKGVQISACCTQTLLTWSPIWNKGLNLWRGQWTLFYLGPKEKQKNSDYCWKRSNGPQRTAWKGQERWRGHTPETRGYMQILI